MRSGDRGPVSWRPVGCAARASFCMPGRLQKKETNVTLKSIQRKRWRLELACARAGRVSSVWISIFQVGTISDDFPARLCDHWHGISGRTFSGHPTQMCPAVTGTGSDRANDWNDSDSKMHFWPSQSPSRTSLTCRRLRVIKWSYLSSAKITGWSAKSPREQPEFRRPARSRVWAWASRLGWPPRLAGSCFKISSLTWLGRWSLPEPIALLVGWRRVAATRIMIMTGPTVAAKFQVGRNFKFKLAQWHWQPLTAPPPGRDDPKLQVQVELLNLNFFHFDPGERARSWDRDPPWLALALHGSDEPDSERCQTRPLRLFWKVFCLFCHELKIAFFPWKVLIIIQFQFTSSSHDWRTLSTYPWTFVIWAKIQSWIRKHQSLHKDSLD